jgi:putative ABC transport system ATP-binding protein
LDSRSGADLLGFLRKAVRELAQTVVMVTHDPVAAGHADRVLFLADGRIVDEMHDPSADQVFDYMKHLGD